MVSYAKSLVDDIEFSCEDASRSDPEFLYEVIQLAITSGATTVSYTHLTLPTICSV